MNKQRKVVITTTYNEMGTIIDTKAEEVAQPSVEPKPVCEDAISKHDLWRIIEDNAYWVTYNETSKEKGMTLTGINQALNECPPVTPTERTGEWKSEGDCGITRCGQCGWSIEECIEWDYCPNCGAKMGGDVE